MRELLGGFALGQLDRDATVSVQAHVDGCPSCHAELAEIAPVAAALRDVDLARIETVAAPAPDLGDRIVSEIRRSHRDRSGRASLRLAGSGLLAAAAVAAAFVVGARVGLPGTTTVAAPPPVEAIELRSNNPTVTADGGLVTHTWGTEIKLVAAGLDQGATYKVTFVDDAGEEVSAGTFLGTGSRAVTCSLNAALPRDTAARVVITDTAGAVVLDAAA